MEEAKEARLVREIVAQYGVPVDLVKQLVIALLRRAELDGLAPACSPFILLDCMREIEE